MRAAEDRLETEGGHRGHRRRSAQGGIGQFEEGVAPTPAAATEALSKLDQLTQRPRSRRPFRHARQYYYYRSKKLGYWGGGNDGNQEDDHSTGDL